MVLTKKHISILKSLPKMPPQFSQFLTKKGTASPQFFGGNRSLNTEIWGAKDATVESSPLRPKNGTVNNGKRRIVFLLN